ncbi:hypothetical protein EDE05_101356 [Neorhizobium sp. R1-B]|jgi:hypothetical protein|uniref:hypothetical protein n=1 Tax=Neorhizobium TaxID=1525371 RepID=UPI000CF96E7A|nr:MULTISPECIES: hypothetical protein [Neorhizobium]TCV75912.1 hypothetical protein EDE09_101195 [Neorhizobium sp. S3-V5DH]TDX89042.1 hypothetical protein EDE05_101356 [Neorhizobium sp. R1-B]
MHTYYRYHGTDPAPGALIIKFYHSGDQVRGFIRKVTEPSEDDMVFPGEEMEPEAAFRMAENKSRGPEQHPIYVELAEGLEWDPAWGKLI